MSSKDTRIVQMRFNNQQFEKGIRQSLNSLEQLKKSLDFTGAVRGMEDINRAGRNVKLDGIGNSLDYLTGRFSMWSIAGITAIQNITNSAVNAGKRIAYAMTLKPLKTGFDEYETQINAIQTILANTQKENTNVDIVNKALDELNRYADLTIYNFTEMTRNIGTFTAAGVKLQTSVEAIKGIANLAAVSGSTSMQASTAMYQLSQAISSGTVRLMDWNSVVNAGMGGAVFQDALKETARVSGVEIDKIIEHTGSFRESLSQGWLSSEILVDTLAKFTGDLSREQLKQKGYTEEQIEEIIKLGTMANDAATKVKTFTQLMDTLAEAAQSGWSQTWRYLVGDFEEAKKLFTEISDVLGTVIGNSANARNEIVGGFVELGGREDLIQSLRNTFYGLASILKPIREAFRTIFPRSTAQQWKNMSEVLVKFTERIKMGEESSKKLKDIFTGIFSVLGIGIDLFKKAVKFLWGFTDGAGELSDKIFTAAAKVGLFFTRLRDGINMSGFINGTLETFKGLFETIKDKLDASTGAVKTAYDAFTKFFDGIGIKMAPVNNIFTKIGDTMSWFFGRLRENTLDSVYTFGSVRKAVWDFFAGLKEKFPLLEAIGRGITTAFRKVGQIITQALTMDNISDALKLINEGILTKILWNISNFSAKFSGGFNFGFGDFFGTIKDGLEAWQQSLKADIIQKLAISIGILAAALIVLTTIDHDQLVAALGAITLVFVELIGAMQLGALGGAGFLKLFAMGNAIRNIATAVAILSGALFLISKIDQEDIIKGLKAIGILLAQLATFMVVSKLGKAGIRSALGLNLLAASLLIFGRAVRKFGEMEPEKLGQGLGAMGIVLAQLAIFSRLGSGKGMIGLGIGLNFVGAAMVIFAEAVARFGAMPIAQIGVGIVGIGAALLMLAGALRLMPKGIVFMSVGLLILSKALDILSDTFIKLSGMSMEEIGRALLILAGGLGAIVAAMYGLKMAGGSAIALLIIAAALNMFSKSLRRLGEMSLGEIGKSLLALVGVFVILGAASFILAPLTPVMLALALAIGALGLALTVVSAGILLFSVAITALSVAITAGSGAIVLAFSAIFEMIPALMKSVGEGIVELGLVLIQGLESIITQACETIVRVTPTILDAVFFFINAILTKVDEELPGIVEKGISIITNFVDGVLTGLAENIGDIIDAATELTTEFLDGISRNLPDIIDSAFDVVISFIQGLADAIDEKHEALFDAVGDLITAIVDAIVDFSQTITDSGREIIKDFIKGIGEKMSDMYDKGKEIIKEFINGIKKGFKIKKDEVLDSALGVFDNLVSGVKDFLGIRSPSRVGAEIGSFFNEGVAKGLNDTTDSVAEAAAGFKDSVVDSIAEALNGIGDEIEDSDISPIITPVVDLSAIDVLDSITGGEIPVDIMESPVNRTSSPTTQNDPMGISGGQSINFTQNNYSPESLSPTEIYRQTSNQISRLKGAFSS